jgi:hypothetical protein
MGNLDRHARARLLVKNNKTDEALTRYPAFLYSWKNADPNVALSRCAKLEFAELN